MSDPKYTTMVALHHAIHQKPIEFGQQVNGLLADRIQNAVEKKREEVANNIFGAPDKEPEVDATPAEEGNAEETSEPEVSTEVEAEAEEEKLETPSEE